MQLIIVTPERAVLDQTADLVVLPLFDGEQGVQTGHSAFVAQLGPGELRMTAGMATTRYFVDGGFVQVTKDVINVLTPRALPASEVTPEKAAAIRRKPRRLPSSNPTERAARGIAIERAQGMARVAAKK